MQIKYVRSLYYNVIKDINAFVSSEQHSTYSFLSTVLIISLQPVKEGTFRNSGPCVDLGT